MNERIKQSILRYRKHVKAMLDFKTSKATVYSTRTQVWKKLGERLDKVEAQRRKEKAKS